MSTPDGVTEVERAPATPWEVSPASAPNATAPSGAPTRAPRRARRLVTVVLGVGLVVAAAVAAYLVWDDEHYVRTDNAAVAGDVVSVSSVAAGKLLTWNAYVGQTVRAGTLLGAIRVEGAAVPGAPATYVDVKAPAAGVVVQSTAVAGQLVSPGVPLAVVADVADLWVTANVSEQDVHRLRVGQRVDVSVDAIPGVRIAGQVEAIAQATQSTFSILPTSNTGGQFTKVGQLVPVRIRLDPEAMAAGLAVGESAEVTIHVQ
ncbi:MAG: efflux RND transporter periplasmic adaptor subunit [Chloroflexota bacterium]|nr:efflux RND transporter periplasmic adaptor subunit [Chloroflexota bacterium]MDE3192547.1 efflux RND transporter periplasmic adaptor subunit [Chloroflexota bacterium]